MCFRLIISTEGIRLLVKGERLDHVHMLMSLCLDLNHCYLVFTL